MDNLLRRQTIPQMKLLQHPSPQAMPWERSHLIGPDFRFCIYNTFKLIVKLEHVWCELFD
ncbi:hypothetical protein HanIR_Chr04g0193931 [Helianthus annuus]|nr:hypothetical protein HanIR_Chr04g0193931 [Helianthus annuus]